MERKKIEHRGYTVEQTSNYHIWIGKKGKMVCHAQCTKKLTDDELKEYVDTLLEIIERRHDN